MQLTAADGRFSNSFLILAFGFGATKIYAGIQDPVLELIKTVERGYDIGCRDQDGARNLLQRGWVLDMNLTETEGSKHRRSVLVTFDEYHTSRQYIAIAGLFLATVITLFACLFIMKWDSTRRAPSCQREGSLNSFGNTVGDNDDSVRQPIKQERAMHYETHDLGSWKTFSFHAGTVWSSALLWRVTSSLLVVSLVVATGLFFLSSEPEAIDTSKFDIISNFLKVFVAFLLGYFMANAVERWTNTVDGFLELFDSCRNLVMQLHALGAPQERTQQCARYGMLSAKFLDMDLRARLMDTREEKANVDASFDQMRDAGELQHNEKESLIQVEDHAATIWIWVALLLGRMAEDGEIPGMASPTYGRLIKEAQSAQSGIRRVRVSVVVQTPFVYVHTLALLVHTNNILCAISFGCSLGTSVAAIHKLLIGKPSMLDLKVEGATVEQELLGIVMSFLTCFVAPLLYQAFLQIGLALSQPFGSELGSIPVLSMIDKLRRDLDHARLFADDVPNFERPSFNHRWEPIQASRVGG